MLHHAHEGDLVDWPLEHTEGQALTFLAIASRVQGVEPGVYAYVHHAHTLAVAKPVIAFEKMIDLFVQLEFASAPVIIWISGNLAAACARHGAFGHRQLLLRAGAAANRLWMAAMAMDLEGCIVAGVVPGAARQQLGLDGYRYASLIAFAAGYGAKLSPSIPGLV
jgi:nitroreductase